MAERAAGFPTGEAAGLSHRRPTLLAIAAVMLTLVLALVFVLGYYALTRRPVTDLPVVEQATLSVPPRWLFSFGQVAEPIGLAVTPDGQRIYVAEGGGDRLIKVFDREGKKVGELAPPDSKPGTRKPGHLAVDKSGRVYAIDRLRAAIDTYSPSLEWQGAFQAGGDSGQPAWVPNGVSVAPDGHLYVAEIGQAEQSVLVLDSDGAVVDRLGKDSGLPAGLNYPDEAVVDGEGRIYISDGNNGRVLAISPRGVTIVGTAGKEALALARGLAIDAGKLFVADAANNRIVVFALGDLPRFLYAFGDSNDEQGLARPNAVGIDRSGRVYVADRGNNRVTVWTY